MARQPNPAKNWWDSFWTTYDAIFQMDFRTKLVVSLWKREADQYLKAAQANGAERERLGAALEIAVMALRGKHSARKAIGQAKRVWKDIYGDSL